MAGLPLVPYCTQALVQAGEYLSEEYKVKKILTLFGDGDKADEVLKQLDTESYERLNADLSEDNDEGEVIPTEQNETANNGDSAAQGA